jgi:hypothetical protein
MCVRSARQVLMAALLSGPCRRLCDACTTRLQMNINKSKHCVLYVRSILRTKMLLSIEIYKFNEQCPSTPAVLHVHFTFMLQDA